MDKPLCQRFEDTEEKNTNNQRLAGLQHQAQQPHLATEADVKTDTKTRERTEGAVEDRVKHEDTSSARVDHDPMRQTNSDDDCTESPALPICRDDDLVDEGAERQSRVSHPERCARQHPPVACCSPAQPLQRWMPYFSNRLFLGASIKIPRNLVRRQQSRHTPRTAVSGTGRPLKRN